MERATTRTGTRVEEAASEKPLRKRKLGILELALTAALASGCVLGGKSEPPRYFHPPLREPVSVAPEERRPLHLAAIRAASHLRERITWRASEVEVGFYENRRWLEEPRRIVERALTMGLFRAGPFLEAGDSQAPALHVQVEAFEESFTGNHEARIVLDLTLTRADGSAAHERVRASRPVAGTGPEPLARAIGEALGEVVNATRDWTDRSLRTKPLADPEINDVESAPTP